MYETIALAGALTRHLEVLNRAATVHGLVFAARAIESVADGSEWRHVVADLKLTARDAIIRCCADRCSDYVPSTAAIARSALLKAAARITRLEWAADRRMHGAVGDAERLMMLVRSLGTRLYTHTCSI